MKYWLPILALLLWAIPAAPLLAITQPTLPQSTVDLTMPTQTGTVRNVTAGNFSSLQSAINAATCGDTIVIPANNTYTGDLAIPNEGACSGWILVESDAIASLPSGTRVSGSCTSDDVCPAPSAGTIANMATLTSSTANQAIISIADSAHNWRFIGIEVVNGTGVSQNDGLIAMGESTSVLGNLPSYIIFDRCYIHAEVTAAVHRGISFQAAYGAVVDSDIRGISQAGLDTQAIGEWNGAGPYLIQNNFLSAASENILFGGAGSTISNLQPSNITVIGNHFWKDYDAWNGAGLNIKNLFELKKANQGLVDGNVFDYSWVDGQNGYGWLITPRGDGCSTCGDWDWTFTHNLMRHVGSGGESSGADDSSASQTVSRISIQNNVFFDVSSATYGGNGYGFSNYTGGGISALPATDIDMSHNDFLANQGSLVSGDSNLSADQIIHYKWANNIGLEGNYSVGGANCYGAPATCFTFFFNPPYTYADFLVITASGSSDGRTYPSGGTFFASTSTAGFTDYAGGDYELTGGSPYHNAGSDGHDIGVWDWTCYNLTTAAALAGTYNSSTMGSCYPSGSSPSTPAAPSNVMILFAAKK